MTPEPKFLLVDEIREGTSVETAWNMVRVALEVGVSLELVRRIKDGEAVIELRAWERIRDDRSNQKSARPEVGYTCQGDRDGGPSC